MTEPRIYLRSIHLERFGRFHDTVVGPFSDRMNIVLGANEAGKTTVASFVGGVLSMRLGVMRILMLGAVLSAGSNLLFAWLAGHGHDVTALIAVVSADNLASGIASAAFIAYLSSLTNVSYSATQYALFSSMMLLLPKFVAGFSGDFVDSFGYAQFFTTTSLLGLPVLGLVWLASRVADSRTKCTKQ